MALTLTMTTLKSLLPVFHPHRIHFSFIIVAAAADVLQLFGRQLSATWLTAERKSYID